MKTWFVPLAAALLGLVEASDADGIQKWRTSDGSLYFGDHPPAGSTLLETYADTPAPPDPSSPDTASEDSSLSKAAAEGRDIMRRREEERAEQRRADQEREARQAEVAAAVAAANAYDGENSWFIVTNPVAPCRVGERCVRQPYPNPDRHRGQGPVASPPIAGVGPVTSPPSRPAPLPAPAPGAGRGRRAVR